VRGRGGSGGSSADHDRVVGFFHGGILER
jgi:hypothetical protein